jgi:hypothetical protein
MFQLKKPISFKSNKRLLEMLLEEKQPFGIISCGLRSIFSYIPDEEPVETVEK